MIAGRKNTGQVSGEIRYGGAPPGKAFLRRCVGYVEQFNTLLPILSVEEMLMYTCQLKRARQEPWDSKSAAVEVGGCCCSARDACRSLDRHLQAHGQ